jgi:hypothetical protein
VADTADDHPRTGHGDDEMHWGISYLREDIQDLRAMIVRLEARFDDRLDRQGEKFDDRLNHLDAKFDDRFNKLDARFGSRFDQQDARFDEIHRTIREQGLELTQRMAVLVGLMTTVILAAIKL